MTYGQVTLEERLKEDIRRYHAADLYEVPVVEWLMQKICREFGMELLLTDRHGERAVVCGNFDGFEPDVVKDPGRRVRIYDHTTGHLYVKETPDGSIQQKQVPLENAEAEEALQMLIKMLADWGEKAYLAAELADYRNELENRLAEECRRMRDSERRDILTGTLGKAYFESRLKALDKAGVAPVALIQANINDWKYFHDTYGIEESDRLISEVGRLLLSEAQPDYLVGRCGGDSFNIVIPMPREGEAQDYVNRVRASVEAYEDPILVPSVAFGIVYKENVEESLFDKLSDAEYEMFNDKLQIKNRPGYRTWLTKGKE